MYSNGEVKHPAKVQCNDCLISSEDPVALAKGLTLSISIEFNIKLKASFPFSGNCKFSLHYNANLRVPPECCKHDKRTTNEISFCLMAIIFMQSQK